MKRSTVGAICVLLLSMGGANVQALVYAGIPLPIVPCVWEEDSNQCVVRDEAGIMLLDQLFNGRLWRAILEDLEIEELTELANMPTEQLVPEAGETFSGSIRAAVLSYFNTRQSMAEEVLKGRMMLAEVQEFVDAYAPSCEALVDWSLDRDLVVITPVSLVLPFSAGSPVTLPGALVTVQLSSGNVLVERVHCS